MQYMQEKFEFNIIRLSIQGKKISESKMFKGAETKVTTHTHIYKHTSTNAPTNIYMFVVYMYVYTHIYIHVYVCISTYKYV